MNRIGKASIVLGIPALFVLTVFAVGETGAQSSERPDGSTDAPDGAPAAVPVEAKAGPTVEKNGYVMLVGTGTNKRLVIKDEAGGSTTLQGPLCAELHRAQHLGVRLKGRMDEQGRLVVADYEITDAGRGVKPLMGRLELADGRLFLRAQNGAEGTELTGRSGVMSKLKAAAGSKAWVTGEIKDGGLFKVKTFGVLEGK